MDGGVAIWRVSLVLSLCLLGCGAEVERRARRVALTQTDYREESEKKVVAFCSACHVMPLAESFPRDAWHHEVMRGYEFYAKSGRKDLDPPAPTAAIAYFRSRAPQMLELGKLIEGGADAPSSFEVKEIGRATANDPAPVGLAQLTMGPLLGGEKRGLYALDMRRGELLELERGNERWQLMYRGLRNPCHIEATDLDGDGMGDAVIADLGSYNPEDHAYGRVLWMRPRDKSWRVEELLADVGRVADVRAADFNQDGKPDLVVAEFGWQKRGSVWVLMQSEKTKDGRPEFSKKRVLELHGTSHVPVGDFDGDGAIDFVALVSQEHERMILFRNRASGEFEPNVIWQANDPAFGLSGVEAVDLDKDGDLDLLFTSGDTFDSPYLKPSHGIHWLENKGADGFAYHRIAHLLAAYSARTGDLDGDGDLDIVASCWAPREMPSGVDPAKLPAVVCCMQGETGKFEMTVIHRGAPIYVGLTLGDVDEDGDLDVAVGSHQVNLQGAAGGLLFLNQGAASRKLLK